MYLPEILFDALFSIFPSAEPPGVPPPPTPPPPPPEPPPPPPPPRSFLTLCCRSSLNNAEAGYPTH